MTNILITGGAGFIGSRLARELNARGHAVTIFDSLVPQVHGTDATNGELYRAAADVGPVIIGDVTDRSAVESALKGQEAVVHLAAETGTGQSMYEIERYVSSNIGGTSVLLDVLANQSGRSVAKIVVASSRSIYGEGRYLSKTVGYVYPATRLEEDLLAGMFDPRHPTGSGQLEMVPTTEDSKIHPSSVYGITKSTQEQLVMTVAPTLGISPVALRYQNVYGPGQSLSNPYTGILSIFSTLILKGSPINVFEDGRESRDFVYVDDVVSVTADATLDDRANGHVLNVGSGEATSVMTVVDELMRAYGRSVPVDVTGNFRLGDIRHNVADLAQIKMILGYNPRTGFREGLTQFARWVQGQEIRDGGYEGSLDEMRRRQLLK